MPELAVLTDNKTDAKIAHLNKKIRELYIMTGELSDEIRKLRDDNKMLWQSLSDYRKEFHKAETQKRLM